MTGKVLDSWTLTKPADWEPDFNVRNLFTSYFISNYSTTDFLESTGADSALSFFICTHALASACALPCSVPGHSSLFPITHMLGHQPVLISALCQQAVQGIHEKPAAPFRV